MCLYSNVFILIVALVEDRVGVFALLDCLRDSLVDELMEEDCNQTSDYWKRDVNVDALYHYRLVH